MTQRLKIIPAVFILLMLFCASIGIRLRYAAETFSGFIPYSAESASHYHYARLIQEHKSVSALDKTIQYPEGLRVFKKTCIFMEYFVAWLYNSVFKKTISMDFQSFTRFSMPLFYSFSLFAVFLSAFTLTKQIPEALVAAALLVLSKASVERSTGFEFLSENFSLPFIFFHFAFVLAGFQAPQKKKMFLFTLSGIFLSIALASWKIAQFYLLVFSVFLVMVFLWDEKEKASVKSCALATTACCVISGMLIPYLREGIFLLSSPCLLLYFIFFAPVPNKSRNMRCGAFLAFCTIAFFVYYFFLPLSFKTAMYSHVYGMIYYKIKFFLHKPANPSFLPAEVRAFWVAPFLSPSLKEILDTFPMLLVFSLAACMTLTRQFFVKKSSITQIFLLFTNICFFVFYVFFTRMRAFLVFFNCLSCVLCLQKIKHKRYDIFVAVCSLVLFTEGYHTLAGQKSLITRTIYNIPSSRPAVKLSMLYENELLEAVRKHTRRNDVVLTRWALSPMIHAYTGRNIVLHAFFESEDIRRKNQMSNELLFSTEESLYKKCKTVWHATILIVANNMVDENTNSERYMADIKELHPDMAVVKLLQHGEQLHRFRLLYENPAYRMFRVAD